MNHLASEKSPYLLQHAGNPVEWYPWGSEAFDRARAEDKPIFLSVGYATCHWCHVMERESFEDPALAATLSEGYVSIKVDREERPDVDRLYMLFVQATTGSGGWPMSVWLTPRLVPFYGGTYFPPDGRGGRPGFASVLREISRAWRNDRADLERSAARLVERLSALAASGGPVASRLPGPEALAAAVDSFGASFDALRGGFGGAPKFPRPSDLLFLLREHRRTGSAPARDMAVRTLRAIADGGMRDHVGGGFHRYCVDTDWRVPHFEKMLYDQAQLVVAFLEAAQATGDRAFAEVADETLAYVEREMTDAGGGFYSAEDADSLPPDLADMPGGRKSEGAFYLWESGELAALLEDDASLVNSRFGIERGGNAPFDPHGEFAGKNVLYLASPISRIAAERGSDEAEVRAGLDRARRAMYAARAARPRPERDDKILTAWNGLMITACARGSRVLGTPRHLEAAGRAASFLRLRMWDPQARTLHRRYRDGDVAIEGFAEDYAFLIQGLLELYQAGGESRWLDWALDLQRRMDELFRDDAGGGWFATTEADSSVILRLKDLHDGAEPAASSVGTSNLIVMAHLTGETSWRDRAGHALRGAAARIGDAPRSAPMMLAALSAWHSGAGDVLGPAGAMIPARP